MKLDERMSNILGILSNSFLWKSFIGLLQRMTDTGDKAYAELEDIKVEMVKTNELLEDIRKALTMGRWK